MPPSPPIPADARLLAPLRRGIDGLDDALLLLLAGRRRLVAVAGAIKRRRGLPVRDPVREACIHARGQRLARHLGLPGELARRQLGLVIADACRQQERAPDPDQGVTGPAPGTLSSAMTPSADTNPLARTLLRRFPPPARWAPLIRRWPPAWQGRLLEAAVTHLLAQPLRAGQLDFMQGRRLGIEVSDLGLHWVLALQGEHLRATQEPAEATVRGEATDLLLLASRLEDADTLFFQRRLELTGDTELGLTARNLLDRLPWEEVPLAVRILLNRAARWALAARRAHRGEA